MLQSFLDILDVGAALGTVGGAVAFLITQEALLLSLPIALPLVALIASRKRENLSAQVSAGLPQ